MHASTRHTFGDDKSIRGSAKIDGQWYGSKVIKINDSFLLLASHDVAFLCAEHNEAMHWKQCQSIDL